jgi:glutamine synthetase
MIVMEVMRQIADKHGLVCLLHEKPFAGINGSGKHNNWSVVGPDGKNWLYPGKTPHDNAKFLTLLVRGHQGLILMPIFYASLWLPR